MSDCSSSTFAQLLEQRRRKNLHTAKVILRLKLKIINPLTEIRLDLQTKENLHTAKVILRLKLKIINPLTEIRLDLYSNRPQLKITDEVETYTLPR